jgi:hypothetical protein
MKAQGIVIANYDHNVVLRTKGQSGFDNIFDEEIPKIQSWLEEHNGENMFVCHRFSADGAAGWMW